LTFLRLLLIGLATLAALAAAVAAAALLPPFQTWYARMELDDLPDVRASLGSVWARFGKVEVSDLRLDLGDAVLTLPSLEARLPVVDTIRRRHLLLKGLVAKGWTLDLSRIPDAERDTADAAPAGGAPAQAAARAFAGILSGWSLPFDASLDGADLEGDVLVTVDPRKEPVRVHVVIQGGGMAAGREGAFTFTAETAAAGSGAAGASLSAKGQLAVSMGTPRVVGRAGVRADVALARGPLREELAVAAAASADRAAGTESYTLSLARGGRSLVDAAGTYRLSSRRFEGDVNLDLADADLAPLRPGRPPASLKTDGAVHVDADADLAEVHAAGELSSAGRPLASLSPALGRIAGGSLIVKFDLRARGSSIRFGRLSAGYFATGSTGIDEVRVLQAFEMDLATGAVKPADPASDWLEARFGDMPLAWLPELPGGLAFAGGEALGAFFVRANGDGYTLRTTALEAKGASIRAKAGVVASGLDLHAALSADYDSKRLQVQLAPLSVASGGRPLASLTAKGSRPSGAGQAMAVSGTGTADLVALATLPACPGLRWIPARSATFDFTGNIGASSDIEAKLSVAGRDPGNSIETTLNADVDASGAGNFIAPVKVAAGGRSSDISVEGSWGRQRLDPRVEVKVTGDDVGLDQLLMLAAPLAAAGGAGSGDGVPFWGNWAGSLKVSFDKLRTGDQDFTSVGGTLEFDRGGIQLEGGHGEVPPKSLASVEATIAFDPSAAQPYRLTGTLAPVANLDSALLLPARPGQDPVIEGKFSLAGKITGSGRSMGDLLSHTEEEVQLSSSAGIVRLLATNVADAIPEAAAPVSDSVEAVGDFVGSVLLGIKGHSLDPKRNTVSTPAEAVISFTNQVSEIGYDRVSVTAVRGADRTIRLLDLEMVAPDAHLKGTGTIAYARGLAVSDEPLTLDLRLGVKDVSATLLSKVGLLSGDRDGLGYPLLGEPIRFGGSLARIDDKQWHDLLAKAAAQKAKKKEKAGP